jgi:hypothetical protein
MRLYKREGRKGIHIDDWGSYRIGDTANNILGMTKAEG